MWEEIVYIYLTSKIFYNGHLVAWVDFIQREKFSTKFMMYTQNNQLQKKLFYTIIVLPK